MRICGNEYVQALVHPFEPKEPTQFWCGPCDGSLVDSEKPETGKFFLVAGHELGYEGKIGNGWRTVIFAVCSICSAGKNEDEA